MYVIVNIDKHQGDVLITDAFDWERHRRDADGGATLIVDVPGRRRYYLGRWAPCDVRVFAGLDPRLVALAEASDDLVSRLGAQREKFLKEIST